MCYANLMGRDNEDEKCPITYNEQVDKFFILDILEQSFSFNLLEMQ